MTCLSPEKIIILYMEFLKKTIILDKNSKFYEFDIIIKSIAVNCHGRYMTIDVNSIFVPSILNLDSTLICTVG
jgi:hypothetical protein